MRRHLSVLTLITLAACGQQSGDANDAAPTVKKPDLGTTAPASFDLNVDVEAWLSPGTPSKSTVFLAVRDADSGELVAFDEHQPGATGKFSVHLPDALLPGRHYKVGAAMWYAGCLSSNTPVVYEEIKAVSADVTLQLSITKGVDHDPRGCEVLHVPVDLPAGTYGEPSAFSPGQGISLVVSSTGRVYRKSLFVLCPNPPDKCYPSMVGGSTGCGSDITPLPGQKTITLKGGGEHTSLEVTVTIDPASKRFIVKGSTRTWINFMGTCCEWPIDVSLVKQNDSTDGCS